MLPVTRVTTDGLLFVLNGLVIWAILRRNQDQRLVYWFVVAYAFTFAAEAVGVATGAVFGQYAYGDTMWFQWLGVPFAIAFNWCVLTLACNEVVMWALPEPGPKQRKRTRILTAALAAVLTALYDVVIEPVAIALDYWRWADGVIPLQNYLVWALIAFLLSLPLQLLRIRFRSPVLLVYFFAQLFFFLVLNVLL